MRIAWVVPGGVDRSGTERVIPFLLDLMRRLSPEHELHVFALAQEPEPGTWPLLGATVHNLGLTPGPARRQAFSQAVGGLGRFDVAHAFWAHECGEHGLALKRAQRIPLLISITGGELTWQPAIGYGGARGWRQRLHLRRQLAAADQISGPSDFVGAMIRSFGREPLRWVMGVDTAFFTPPDQRPAGPPWSLVHVASLNQVKGPWVMLEAMRRIVAEEPSARLDWLGVDTLGGEVQRRAEALGLHAAIAFRGWQDRDAVRDAFRTAHLHLMASYHEAGQLVAIEAGASGLPTVGTAVGHLPEMHPDCGVSVPVGDAAALARETLALLRDGPRREAMGRAARAWAVSHDADRSAAELLRIYRGLVEAGS